MEAADLKKMRAFADTGGVLSHDDAVNLLTLTERYHEALQDILAGSGRAKVLQIMHELGLVEGANNA